MECRFRWSLGIASWNCCFNGIATESKPISVSVGDKIKGIVRDTCAAWTLSCPTWTVETTDGTQNLTTSLPTTSSHGQTFNRAAAGALGAYNIVQCTDYPPGGQLTFSAVTVDDDNLNPISNPHWSATGNFSGLTPNAATAS
jgi:hypothetical protein